MNVSRYGVLAAVAAGLMALDGCNSCASFNPFKQYQQTPVDPGESPKDVPPGRFHLACRIGRPSDTEFAKKAIEQALRDSGGGSVSELTGAEREQALRQFAQSTGGAYWSGESGGKSAVRLKLGNYRVVFDAPGLDLASDFDVEWTGGPGDPLVLPVNTDDGHVTLLHNGGHEYELVFDGKKVGGNGLLVDSTTDRPKGSRRFQPLPFRLESGARGEGGKVQAGEEVKLEPKLEEAEVLRDESLLIFEVKDFHGDMSAFLCGLLSRELSLAEGDDRAEDAVKVSFAMRETDVWLEAAVKGGRANLIVEAEFVVYNAPDKASSLKVEVAGLPPVSATDGAEVAPGAPTLTQRFEGVNLVFKLVYPLEPGMRPADDYVTFVYSIAGGPEQRDRVKHSLAGRR